MRRIHPFLFFAVFLLLRCGSGEDAQKYIVGDMLDANVSYEYAREMLLDSIHRYEFVLSKNMNGEDIISLAPSLAASDAVNEKAVKVGDYVSAQLIDPSQGENFDIVPLSLEEQSIFSRDTFACLWQWDIRPLKIGTLPLRLKVLTRVDEHELDIPVFDSNIEVYSNETEEIPLAYAGVAVAVLGLLAFLFFRKKKAKQERSHLPNTLAMEIKKLVGDGKTVEALELLEAHLEQVKSVHLNDVIVLQSNFQDAVRKNNVGVLASDEFRQEAAKVNFALLDLVKILS